MSDGISDSKVKRTTESDQKREKLRKLIFVHPSAVQCVKNINKEQKLNLIDEIKCQEVPESHNKTVERISSINRVQQMVSFIL